CSSSTVHLGCVHSFGEAYPIAVVHHHHLAMGDQAIVHVHIQGVARRPFKLHDGAGRQLQEIADRHARASDLQGQAHVDVEHHVGGGFDRWDSSGHADFLTKASRELLVLRAFICRTLTTWEPRCWPSSPQNSGMPSASTVAWPSQSMGITSPGRMSMSWDTVVVAVPRRVTRSTSDSSSSLRSSCDQRSSRSARSVCMPARSVSFSGSSIE